MLLQNLGSAIRTLRHGGMLTAAAVLSLALGIGANSGIFGLIDAMVLRKLPVKHPEGLYILGDPAVTEDVSMGSQTIEFFSYPTYRHLLERSRVFSELCASGDIPHLDLTIGGKPSTGALKGRLVSGTYFPLLGVKAQIGRTFGPEDDRLKGANPVIVIGDRLWRERFGADPRILDQVVGLNETKYSIIGVLPPEFTGEIVGARIDIWVPMTMQEAVMPGQHWLDDWRVSWLQMMARLQPGLTLERARPEADAVIHQILIDQEKPPMDQEAVRSFGQRHLTMSSGATGFSKLRADFAQPLFILMSVVGLVLLIACANVANLLLARAAGREKEIGIRIALGASRGRLAGQLLTESVLLAVAGAALGLVFASWGSSLLLHLVDRQGVPLDVRLDWRMLGFTSGVALLTGILFGLAPALRAARVDISSGLRESGRAITSSAARLSFGKALVAAQVGLSLLLIIGAGLFLRSLQNLLNVNLGYERDHLLTMYADATPAGYQGARAQALWRNILDTLSRLPGVAAATGSQNGLFNGAEGSTSISVEGYTGSSPEGRSAAFDQVAANYFQTVGVPILAGRGFEPGDNEAGPKVAVINESMARFYFPNSNPIGRHFTYQTGGGRSSAREIVGVSRDLRDHSLKEKVARRFYLPAAQPFTEPITFQMIVIRTRANPEAIANMARAAIKSIDPAIPVDDPTPLKIAVENTMTQERLIAELSAFFGGLALLLASIGLYGVMSYSMSRRTNEIGIRMALGAEPRQVLGMVIGESLLMVGIGVVVGLPAALALSRLIESRLFGVQARDPLTIVAATLVLVGVAAAAAFFPALKAARLSPVESLRYE